MVGLNPEFAHETMSGLSFHHAVAQTLWSGKLFHIDLNGQVPSKYDQDFRFGSEGIRDAFYLVKLLEDAQWPGMRHFDAHAYRTEDDDGVWDFARGCIRTYLDPAREGAALPRRRRDPGRARDRNGRPARGAGVADASRPTRSRAMRTRPARPRRHGDARLRPRAARPARDRAAARRPLSNPRPEPRMPLVLGVDSSTQSTKVEVARRRHGRAASRSAARRIRPRRRRGASRTRARGGTRCDAAVRGARA